MWVSRVQADEMDQTVLLSANSIATKFEFEIRRALTMPIGQNNFSADQSTIFEMREFGSKIHAEHISLCQCKNKNVS